MSAHRVAARIGGIVSALAAQRNAAFIKHQHHQHQQASNQQACK